MDFNTYQSLTNETAIYPRAQALEYLGLGLTSEAGEVAGKLKKIIRGDHPLDEQQVQALEAEIGDCLWYLAQLCEAINSNLDDVAAQNIGKLLDRQDRKVIRGNGDDR